MRITQSMMTTRVIQDLNANLNRLARYTEHLSTGHKVNRPSDDPVAMTSILRYNSELRANDQYLSNAEDARSRLDFLDQVLSQINSVLQRARELAVQGANGTNPQEAREAIAAEVEQLLEQLVSLGNSQFKGKYIFNGQMTTTKPFDSGKIEADHTGVIEMEVFPDVMIQINVSGNELFGAENDSDNAFRVLEELADALREEDTQGINDALSNLDSRMDKLLHVWADVGARQNRLDLSINRLRDTDLNLQSLLSHEQDTDIAYTYMKMKEGENVYTASLSVGARIIRPSLVDFLR